jgi:predicted GIY-YIG superfamily endonuclease
LTINITMPDDKLTFKRYDYKNVKEILKNKPSGVYFLYDKNDELLYVGKTKNFRGRLLAHFRGRDASCAFYKLIDYVVVYFVGDEYEREVYETYAINTFQPLFNKSKTYYEDKTDQLFEIEERIRELEEEKDEIESDLIDSSMIDKDFEEDSQLLTGIFFHNVKRLHEIDEEIKELKRLKARTF